ncbi:nuclear envelope integral membrane protein 1a isoform X2 [Aethina tumida]|uniref:nuclear envelope integral membrane protein 1a isoform X2 n=1 Tax=Aethina tumida TaxID=116153 RepID=UPI00214909C0|nr:nuclear envelope integral membrane protein 1a isoform X2 [Aethina tumida]
MQFIYFLPIVLFLHLHSSSAKTTAPVFQLEEGRTDRFHPHFSKHLTIFCYDSKPKYIIHLWQSVLLKINHPNSDYVRYDGSTPEEVEWKYMNKQYSWTFNFFTKDKNIKLNPFNDTCVGLETKHEYDISLHVIRIDLWKLLYLACGILLYLSANKLSTNALFYYSCGILVGICASFLVLIYLLSKIIPRKPLMYGVIGCGWTVVLYLTQILWDNLRMVIENYREYLLGYTLITGLISFILCYRWGPVQDDRTKNLIKWTLQIIGLTLVFFSSHFQEAAMGQIVLLVLFHYIPKKWLSAPKSYWVRRFPPKVKLLTNDQYYEEGVRETKKALEELRQYCSSPECNQWKMALKLQNVKRLNKFILNRTD